MSKMKSRSGDRDALIHLVFQKQTINPSLAFKHHPSVLDYRDHNAFGLLHTKKNRHYTLNQVGMVIWDSLKEPSTIEQIVQHVCQKYDNDIEMCIEGVNHLCEELLKQEFLQPCEK